MCDELRMRKRDLSLSIIHRSLLIALAFLIICSLSYQVPASGDNPFLPAVAPLGEQAVPLVIGQAAPTATPEAILEPHPKLDPAIEYAAAVGLVARERFSEASGKLEAILPVAPDPAIALRIRFLAGYCRYRAGSWSEAAGHFENYIKSGGLLLDYARYYRALSLSRSADPKSAVGAWKLYFSSHPNPRWEREAKLSYAEALLADKQPNAAMGILKALLAKTNHPDLSARIMLLMGKCQEARGAPAEARKTYRSIYINYPGSGSAGEAAKRLTALKINPELMTAAERFSRAERLYDGARFEPALEEYTRLLADKRFDKSGESGKKASLRQAMCFFRLYRTDEALAAFQAITREGGVYAVTAIYYTAHCLGRKEKTEEALKAYRLVIEKSPQHSLAPNAYLNIAQIYIEQGKWDEAVENLRAIRRKFASAARELDIPWRIGWIEYRRGNFDKSRAAFQDHPGGRALIERRNDYWAARALERSGKTGEARAEYADILKGKSYDYYGLIAAARAGAPPPSPESNSTPEAHLVGANLSSPLLNRARELAGMGLTEYAADELSDYEAQPGLSAADHFAIGLMYEQYGDFHRSRRTVSRYLKVDCYNYKLENNRYWKMLYPQAYRQVVTDYAKERGIDPNLVWAIMMQESNFQPHIVSFAGARGLMQLINPTAKSVAKRLGIADFKESDLYAPSVNIRFGITYLGDVVKDFGDHPARFYMAVASYNGGPQNVQRWRRARPGLEFDEFVEEIPFNETRNYVKIVFGNWAVYQMLYGKGATDGIIVPTGAPMLPKPPQPAQPQPGSN